jgi:NADPH2:quinone reductase
MARTAIIEAPGGPEQFRIVDREVGDPGPGQIRIRHEACGLNFIDVYQRTGLYPLEMPHALGMEASGIVEAVGEGVTHLKEGDRAAYAAAPPGAYTEARVMGAAQVCPLPDAISMEEGAAMMLKGLTTHYLFRRTTPISPGDTVLFHAAAGGVGLMACQWARPRASGLSEPRARRTNAGSRSTTGRRPASTTATRTGPPRCRT